jgi:hypothetical protein
LTSVQTTTIAETSSSDPSLEAQYEALKAEGLVSDDAEGASTETPQVAQGGAEGEQDGGEDRPSWLPEKYATVEDYLAYVKELEEGKTQEDPEETPEYAEATPEERKAAEEATARAGLDLNNVSKEWFDNGGLTDDTYAKLEKAGYPKDMVDIYIEGLTSRTNSAVNDAYALVGGEDKYGEMIDWAVDNLSDAQQKAFDAAINSNNPAKAMLAIKGLKADWTAALAADASEEPEVQINGKGGPKADTYASLDDYMEDLNDPRYDTNETFRKKVAQKLSRSRIM